MEEPFAVNCFTVRLFSRCSQFKLLHIFVVWNFSEHPTRMKWGVARVYLVHQSLITHLRGRTLTCIWGVTLTSICVRRALTSSVFTIWCRILMFRMYFWSWLLVHFSDDKPMDSHVLLIIPQHNYHNFEFYKKSHIMDQSHVLYFFCSYLLLLCMYMFYVMYCMFFAQCAIYFQLTSYCVQHGTVPMPTAVYMTVSEHISESMEILIISN